jgi:hypothetical protein
MIETFPMYSYGIHEMAAPKLQRAFRLIRHKESVYSEKLIKEYERDRSKVSIGKGGGHKRNRDDF